MEAATPHTSIDPGEPDYVHAEQVGMDSVTLDIARYDPVTQLLAENHIVLSARGISTTPIVCRLITPGEMDLMARIADCALSNGSQTGSKRHSMSDHHAHVSVYGINTGH